MQTSMISRWTIKMTQNPTPFVLFVMLLYSVWNIQELIASLIVEKLAILL